VPVLRISTGYRMLAQHVPSDHSEFHRLSQEGLAALRRHEHERASRLLNAGLRLWRGEPLADVTEHLISAERSQLVENRLEALEGWLEAELELGRHRQIVPELTGLVAHHPLRERFRALLMTALYRSERQAEAMSLYRSGRQILADQLGVEPGLMLVQTYQAILTGEVRTLMPDALAS
jgi:DNA-binding SARP family transcriptional activator